MTPTLNVYMAVDGYRWRLVAGNRKIVADSGESYRTKASAMRAAKRLPALVDSAVIGPLEEPRPWWRLRKGTP